MTKAFGTRLALVALTALGAGVATAAHAEDSVKIMVGGLEKQIYLPFKLTEQLGFFDGLAGNFDQPSL